MTDSVTDSVMDSVVRWELLISYAVRMRAHITAHFPDSFATLRLASGLYIYTGYVFELTKTNLLRLKSWNPTEITRQSAILQ